jgi:hypothetical protein
LNRGRDKVCKTIPKSGWNVVPHTFDEYELGVRDCRGGGTPAAQIAHRVTSSVDNKSRGRKITQFVGSISRRKGRDCLPCGGNLIVVTIPGPSGPYCNIGSVRFIGRRSDD